MPSRSSGKKRSAGGRSRRRFSRTQLIPPKVFLRSLAALAPRNVLHRSWGSLLLNHPPLNTATSADPQYQTSEAVPYAGLPLPYRTGILDLFSELSLGEGGTRKLYVSNQMVKYTMTNACNRTVIIEPHLITWKKSQPLYMQNTAGAFKGIDGYDFPSPFPTDYIAYDPVQFLINMDVENLYTSTINTGAFQFNIGATSPSLKLGPAFLRAFRFKNAVTAKEFIRVKRLKSVRLLPAQSKTWTHRHASRRAYTANDCVQGGAIVPTALNADAADAPTAGLQSVDGRLESSIHNQMNPIELNPALPHLAACKGDSILFFRVYTAPTAGASQSPALDTADSVVLGCGPFTVSLKATVSLVWKHITDIQRHGSTQIDQDYRVYDPLLASTGVPSITLGSTQVNPISGNFQVFNDIAGQAGVNN